MSPKTKPVITFMQNSLVEIFSLDDHLTYQHGFVYIRQLAIHLRNAILQKKKVLFADPPSFLVIEDSVKNVLRHSLACRRSYVWYSQEKMKGYRVPHIVCLSLEVFLRHGDEALDDGARSTYPNMVKLEQNPGYSARPAVVI